jgi:thiosulfate/3-mercaptopyruvate sulfurtransferase
MLKTSRSLLLLALIAPPAAPAVRPDMLVSTDWLTQHLSDPQIVILHVTRNRSTYDAAHIPGARFFGYSDLVITRDGILNELPPAAELKKSLERVGVSDDSHIILYTDAAVVPAARAYFTLDYLGHADRTALLDGGLQKWRTEGRALSTEAPVVTPGRFTPRARPEIVVGLEAVKDFSWAATNTRSPAMILLDVRAAEDYHGAKEPSSEAPRPGHIPGAINVFWMDTQAKESSVLLPEAALRKLYEAAGVTPDRQVVTYCNTGMLSPQTYFTLKYLGYDVRLYDGSIFEWGSAKGTVVEK